MAVPVAATLMLSAGCVPPWSTQPVGPGPDIEIPCGDGQAPRCAPEPPPPTQTCGGETTGCAPSPAPAPPPAQP